MKKNNMPSIKSAKNPHLNATLLRVVSGALDALHQRLVNAPLEFTKGVKSKPLVVDDPSTDGNFGRFGDRRVSEVNGITLKNFP